ncbi:MAG: hypothetical protein IT267_03265 [Saprospiraceae bacterium]|nr:hypothetical protein [Saprospiraceae bacterium]
MIKILFFLFIISFYSCVDYSEVPIPSYLYIPDISLNTKPGEGTDSQYFKDVWVFVDDVYYGAYEIPVQIPIGASGLKNVQVYAGVRKNGINSNPTRYPMTAPFEIKLDMQPKMVYTIHPVVSYYDYNKFPFIENFDQSHLFTGDLDLDNLTQVTLSLPEEAFEGNNSGLISLEKEHPLLVAQFATDKIIPSGPNHVYIELNYKSDIGFEVGLYGYSGGQNPVDLIYAHVKAKTEWNKIYFDFTEIIRKNQREKYRIAIRAQYDTTVQLVRQRVLLDNFKLIYQ